MKPWPRPRSEARSSAASAVSIFTDKARKAGPAARRAIAKARADDLKLTIEEIKAAGITSLGKMAAELTARRVPTARGGSEWTAMQVKRVIDLLA
jgi:hypothetical protein